VHKPLAMILPMLLQQQLTVVSDVNNAGVSNLPNANINQNDTLTFKQSDPLSALLPALLMSGTGDSGNGGTNSSMMLALALALRP
jgi:hypothetical protein